MQYAPSTSRPTTPSSYRRPRTYSSATLKRNKRLQNLRATYSNAARGFLLKDYATTLEFLEDSVEDGGREIMEKGAWIRAILNGEEAPELELQRKLEILKITFVATVYDANPIKSHSNGKPNGSITSLLGLSSPTLIAALWAQAIGIDASTTDIFPSTQAANLHPSIAIALTLAALKMERPQSARLVAEAWFGSISSSLDDLIFETSKSIDLSNTFGIQESSISMSSSGLKEKFPVKKALVGSWLRLLDLLTLHVLPKLGEWEAAGDFVRMQSIENGGWVPDERIEASLRQLEVLQAQEVMMITLKMQRQRDQEAYKLEKERQREKDRKREKGKARARDDGNENSSPPSPDKPTPRTTKKIPTNPNGLPVTQVKGFALLRSTLTTYLRRTSPLTDITSSDLIPLSIKSLPLYLKYYYATLDPLRLLSVVFFVYAFTNWVRNRKKGGGINFKESMSSVLSRVVQTVQMGTKVTSL